MVAALHILSIKVSGWKAIPHDDPVIIDFCDGSEHGRSCLITGPNESGKSSTFSALRYALFEIHDRGGQATSNWVNYFTDNSGEVAKVEVELLINGKKYTIIKQRRGTNAKRVKNSSELFSGVGDDKALLERGKKADEKVLELIGARKGNSRSNEESPESWGLLAWLLAPQGMDSIAPARQSGIDSLGLERSVDHEGSQLLNELNTNLEGILTPTTREPTGEFKSRLEHNENLNDKVRELDIRSEEFSNWLEEISRTESKLEKAEQHAKEADAEWDVFNQTGGVEENTQHSQEKQRLEVERDSQEREVEIAASSVGHLSDIETNLRTEKENASRSLKDETLAVSRKDELVNEQRENDKELNILKAELGEARQSLASTKGMLDSAKKYDEFMQASEAYEVVSKSTEDIKKLLEEGDVLDDDQLTIMKDLHTQLKLTESVLEVQRASSAWVVDVARGFKADIIIDGHSVDDESDGIPLLDEISIRTSDDKDVIVRSTSATETESHVKKHLELMQNLSEYGHETIESLATEISKEMQRNNEFERLSNILGNHPKLDELQQKIESLSEGVPAEPPKLPVEVLDAQVTELSDSVERIQSQIDGVDEKRRQQELLITTARNQADQLITERMAIEARVSVYDAERTKAIDENGSMKTRSGHLEDAKKRLADTQRLLGQIEGSEELKRTARVTEHQRLLKNKTRANKELNNLQIDLAQLKSNLEVAFYEDINSKVHDKTEAMRLDSIELHRYELSVRAKDSLANRLRQKLTEATSIETAPIRDKVQSWLHAVTEGKWTDVQLNERLEVLEIGGPLDTFLPGEHAGSHGLQQVIHALIRLAVATHIYETSSENNPDFPPVTIVMDESQGHVDRDRVSLLMERFNRAIDEGKIQVIALSHRGDEFRSLNPVIEYDMKRREVLDYDLA